jgi:hypothetical protein
MATESHGKIIQVKQPNYNYHHEEREELQMVHNSQDIGCRYGFAGFQVDKFSGWQPE